MTTTMRGDDVGADAPDGGRYNRLAQALHWITPPVVAVQLVLAWVMTNLPEHDARAGLFFSLHKSIGLTIWLLVVARVAWRLTHPAPPHGPDMPRSLALLGGANHWLMYLVLFAMPISGYVMGAMGHGVRFWGVPLPGLPKVPAVEHAAELSHALAQWALYALVLLHITATVFHVAIRRDGLFQRMIPPQVHADPSP